MSRDPTLSYDYGINVMEDIKEIFSALKQERRCSRGNIHLHAIQMLLDEVGRLWLGCWADWTGAPVSEYLTRRTNHHIAQSDYPAFASAHGPFRIILTAVFPCSAPKFSFSFFGSRGTLLLEVTGISPFWGITSQFVETESFVGGACVPYLDTPSPTSSNDPSPRRNNA